jgi:hypothetical protein
MSKDERPIGLYYHEVYLPPQSIEPDKREFRIRYAYLIDGFETYALKAFVVGETAIERFEPQPHKTPRYQLALLTLTMPELLKVMHAVVLYVRQQESHVRRGDGARDHIEKVQRLLKAERLAWEMDDRGGLHPLRDAAYANQRESVIAGLSKPRYANARDIFVKFISAYDDGQPDSKLAINHIFDTAESLFKLRFHPTAPARLDRGTAGQLRTSFPRPSDQHDPEYHLKKATSAMVEGFVNWVEASQQWRHEKGQPDVVNQPPDDIAELIVSAGMAYIRWLIRIDLDQ